MKLYYLLIVFCVLFGHSCIRNNNNRFLAGMWKVERVEVLKDNELKRIIDPGIQYWKFCKTDSIEIFNKRQVQNRLYVKVKKSSIKCFNRLNGSQLDEF